MIHLAIYNTTNGEILRTVVCQESDVEYQAAEEIEAVYIGYIDERTQKIDLTTLEPIDKTEDELITYQYQQVQFQVPLLFDINDIDDETLNTRIANFFFNQVNVETWRIENYRTLRKAAYSPISDRADAAVKIKRGTKTGNAAIVSEGEAQLDAMDDHDWAVKERFPKE